MSEAGRTQASRDRTHAAAGLARTPTPAHRTERRRGGHQPGSRPGPPFGRRSPMAPRTHCASHPNSPTPGARRLAIVRSKPRTASQVTPRQPGRSGAEGDWRGPRSRHMPGHEPGANTALRPPAPAARPRQRPRRRHPARPSSPQSPTPSLRHLADSHQRAARLCMVVATGADGGASRTIVSLRTSAASGTPRVPAASSERRDERDPSSGNHHHLTTASPGHHTAAGPGCGCPGWP